MVFQYVAFVGGPQTPEQRAELNQRLQFRYDDLYRAMQPELDALIPVP